MSVDVCVEKTNSQIIEEIIDEKLNNKEIPLAISSQIKEESKPISTPLSKSMEESEQSTRPSRSRKAPERFDPSKYIVTRIKKSNKITPSQKKDLRTKIEQVKNDPEKKSRVHRAVIKHRLPWIQRAVWLKKRRELQSNPGFQDLQQRIVKHFKEIYTEYKPIPTKSNVEELYLRKIYENRHLKDSITPEDIIDKVNSFIKNTLPIRTLPVTDEEREYLIKKYPKDTFESLIDLINRKSKSLETSDVTATVTAAAAVTAAKMVVCELPNIIKKELEAQIITDEDIKELTDEDIKEYENEMRVKFKSDPLYPVKSEPNFQNFLQSQPQITDEDLIDLDLQYSINKLQERTIGTSSILPTTGTSSILPTRGTSSILPTTGKKREHGEGIKKSSTRKLPKMKLPKMKVPKMKVPKVFKKTVGKNKKPKKGGTCKRKLKVTRRRKQHGGHCKQCHTSKRN